ncbi:nitroreductase family protein [Macrococcus equipercicus]|uniref:Nitroreductase family protein n=1 Tax=Macrococcus equipercicus TaxID=69967 RepID=A0A9Q9F0Z8_9STAP|nr:nitroreductase family protein [Macrococcus equipercicus]KAA1036572.1 nitroreductase family protein [Macrococcus equipercicus]UTH13498.1 nitroreductase family protein [Macrococcus equipercicus]
MSLFNKKDDKQEYKHLEGAMEKRRSVYHLEPKSPISDAEIEKILTEAVKFVPSAFNSQSTRIVLLLNDNHKKLWDLTKDALQEVMGADRDFAATEQKINSFKAAYGTVLFFEDTGVVKGLQEKFSSYAAKFPQWSEHTNAMHQYAIWTAFAVKGLGASLQHYDGVIDEQVYETFSLPKTWRLIAQMPFGSIGSEPGPKDILPVENRLIIKK